MVPETSSAHHAVAPFSRTFLRQSWWNLITYKFQIFPCVLQPVCSQAWEFGAAHGTHRERAEVQPEDLDTAVEATQKEYPFLKSKCEELRLKNLKMADNTDGLEGILHQALEAAQKQGIC